MLLLIVNILPKTSSIKELNPVFWLETIALFSFGISWIVKGESFLKDDKKPKHEAMLNK